MHNNYTLGVSKESNEARGAAVFAERLRASRTKLGFSQEYLAKQLGVSSTTVQNYEAGQYPRAEVAIRLTQILSCSLDWLLRGHATGQSDEAPAQQPQAAIAQSTGATRLIPITGLNASGVSGWYQPLPLALSTPLSAEYAERDVFAVLTMSQTIEPEWIFQGNVLFCERHAGTNVDEIVYVERHDGLAAIRKIISADKDKLGLCELPSPENRPLVEELPLKQLKSLSSILLIKLKP